jgi:hypothetical protein
MTSPAVRRTAVDVRLAVVVFRFGDLDDLAALLNFRALGMLPPPPSSA